MFSNTIDSIINLALIIIGLSLSAKGYRLAKKSNRTNENGAAVRAKVINKETGGSTESMPTNQDDYNVTLEYELKGQTYVTEVKSDGAKVPDVGGTLWILYEPEDPQIVYLPKGKGFWIYLILGILCCVTALVLHLVF